MSGYEARLSPAGLGMRLYPTLLFRKSLCLQIGEYEDFFLYLCVTYHYCLKYHLHLHYKGGGIGAAGA